MKGLLQGVRGGKAYEEYLKSFRREVELADQIDKVKVEMTMLEQLVTIFTITSTVSANPSHVTRLGQLHSAISEKKEWLQDMVICELKKVSLYK